MFDRFQDTAPGSYAMSERLFDEYRFERQTQRFERYFFMRRRICADAHHFRRANTEHFPEIRKELKSRKFQAQLATNLRAEIWAVHIGAVLGIDEAHVEDVVRDAIAAQNAAADAGSNA